MPRPRDQKPKNRRWQQAAGKSHKKSATASAAVGGYGGGSGTDGSAAAWLFADVGANFGWSKQQVKSRDVMSRSCATWTIHTNFVL